MWSVAQGAYHSKSVLWFSGHTIWWKAWHHVLHTSYALFICLLLKEQAINQQGNTTIQGRETNKISVHKATNKQICVETNTEIGRAWTSSERASAVSLAVPGTDLTVSTVPHHVKRLLGGHGIHPPFSQGPGWLNPCKPPPSWRENGHGPSRSLLSLLIFNYDSQMFLELDGGF
jgi:hypothetical protein